MMSESKSATTIRRRKGRSDTSAPHLIHDNASSRTVQHNESSEIAACRSGYLLSNDFLGKTILQNLMLSERTIFLSLLAFRIVNALLIQTYFVPDEYWQSVEVSHRLVFGYGHLTWEWQKGIRGFIYPGMFAVMFKVLSILNLDYRMLIIKMPHLLQACFSAYGDLYTYKFCRKLAGQSVAEWALVCQTLSWFSIYMSCRTLINSTEMVLLIIGLYHYPWPNTYSSKGSWRFVLAVALSVVIRPTAAITWILMCCWHLQKNFVKNPRIVYIYIIIGLPAFLLSYLIDSYFYGKLTFVHYNFFHFNVLSGLNSLFGAHPWYWYITHGFPPIIFTHAYLFVRGIVISEQKVPALIILWNIIFYSALSHKEFRFLYPILPLCMFYCGQYLHHLTEGRINEDQAISLNQTHNLTSDTELNRETSGNPCTSNQTQDVSEIKLSHSVRQDRWKAKLMVLVLAITNIPTALYFCLLHQRGTISVMHYLSKQAYAPLQMNVLYLMPCHSTPYYSYIHKNLTMRFLTCEPNFSHDISYIDETDMFYKNQVKWFRDQYYNSRAFLPTHIVHYDNLDYSVTELIRQNYTLCAKFFHCHFLQGRLSNRVVVQCLK